MVFAMRPYRCAHTSARWVLRQALVGVLFGLVLAGAGTSLRAQEEAAWVPNDADREAYNPFDPPRPDWYVRRSQAPATPAPARPAPAAPRRAATPLPPTPPAAAAPSAAAPGPAAPGALARAVTEETGEAASAATIGSLANLSFSDAPIMLGDMAPLSIRQVLPTPNLQPPPQPNPVQPPVPQAPNLNRNRGAAILPWVRGFKMADNQSPRPQDRVFFTFDYFHDLNQALNRRLGDPVSNIQVYRYLFGVEKTFLDGNASLGLRLPLNSLSATSATPALGGTSTAPGNLTVFSKYILWQNSTGSLISTGLAVTTPNSGTAFAGAPSALGFRDTQLQPFVGYIANMGRWYVQGFEAIDVPTLSRDVTILYNDVGIGYFLYRSQNPCACLTAIVPTFETHVNVPLNHRGSIRLGDPAATPDVVDLTFGTNFVFGRSAIFSVAFVNPVSGPRPFDFEWVALLNVFFGRTRAQVPAPIPPVTGM